MRGRAGAAVSGGQAAARRAAMPVAAWPVSCEKYETGIILHCRSEIVRSFDS
jgi:hypothetical protein